MSGSDLLLSPNCAHYRNYRCGFAGRVCWRGTLELCGRAWGLVGGERKRKRRRFVVALRISRRERRWVSTMSNWSSFFGRRGRWYEIAVMGHFEDESDDRETCLVNEEKGCLSGPSFAFLLAN